ncbi:hypothetical protein R6Q59_018786 [Mikania micrantha]
MDYLVDKHTESTIMENIQGWVNEYYKDGKELCDKPFQRNLLLSYIIRVMIHQPASSFSEVAMGEFILVVRELLKLRETLTRVYVQRTGKPLWVVSEDMKRDVFMSAIEAQAYGIVDLVAVE